MFHIPTGTDVMDGQLMGEFELEAKELEADSWSMVVDNKFVRQQKKDVIKRQDVIYGKCYICSYTEQCRFAL